MKNNDLKQISKLLDQKLDPVQKGVDKQGKMLEQQGKALEQHGKILEDHTKILKQHGKILRSLKKDQDTMLKMLDKEQMDQRKRLKRIEDNLARFQKGLFYQFFFGWDF